MRCWQFGLFLLFSLVSLDVWAQDLPDIERLLEGNDILNTEDGYEEMVDILSNLLMTPVNVNTAGFDSLKMLFLLSDSQIDQLLEFRKKYGNFLHINELLLVPGIGKKDLENIRSFITLGHPEVQDRVKAIRLRIQPILRLISIPGKSMNAKQIIASMALRSGCYSSIKRRSDNICKLV